MAVDEFETPTINSDCESVAPSASEFPAFPVSWYLFCNATEISRKPISKPFLGKQLVGYRTSGGQAVVMDGHCSHLGSDLGQGCVRGDNIKCPFHDWEYGPDGQCIRIPAQSEIPVFAKQVTYPTQEQNGLIFVYNGADPAFPLPFFPECDPAELIPATPFGADLDCPWYMAGANAFDLQHFLASHDRKLKGTPTVRRPSRHSFHSSGTFDVTGDSIRDRLTRRIAGDEVTLALTDWCGSLSFATATFAQTKSYGMVAREPLPEGGVRVQVIVFVRRSQSLIRRAFGDSIRLAIRRYFIRKFLAEDAIRLQGVRYNPRTFIDSDGEMVRYFRFLADVSGGD
jgi:phenylpropionate dioxygenase-like ring-hydroxylating dioxygenase large terminal subunit